MDDIEDIETDRTTLERWTRSPTMAQRVVRRSHIVLLAIDGIPAEQIAERCRVSAATVKLWTLRFRQGGTPALLRDAPGRGRRSSLDPTFRERLRAANLLDGSGQPVSLRRAAAFLGVSPSAVWRAMKRAPRGART
jgi:transposase